MSSVAAMWSPVLFGGALFLSSGLLFLIQPMVGRTLLPHLGGNALAWNACLVFFQATLLAGYVYAALLHRFRGLRWQPWVHLLLLGGAIFFSFAGLFGDQLLKDLSPRFTGLDTSPVFSTLCLLVIAVGVPTFALAAVGPLVQRWFAHLDHPRASDPYFLFVASNLGAQAALVIYPAFIETNAPMVAQWLSWKLAATALGVLLFLVAFCAWRSPRNVEMEPPTKADDPNAPAVPKLIGRGPATTRRGLFWMAAAALPVGLMMAMTDYLTLDVAPAPMLWGLPFALYLLAFSQSFARYTPLAHGGNAFRWILQIMIGLFLAGGLFIITTIVVVDAGRERDEGVLAVFLVIGFMLLWLTPLSWYAVIQPMSVLLVVLDQANLFPLRALTVAPLGLYLICFYSSARLCLGRLAEDRPAATSQTTYFVWIGLGGVCGGLFQLLIAPHLFERGYLEFSLLAALATLLRPAWFAHGLTDWAAARIFLTKPDAPKEAPSPARARLAVACDLAFALGLAVIAGIVFAWLRTSVRSPHVGARGFGVLFLDFPLVLVLFLTAVLYARPLRFGLALLAVVLLSVLGNRGSSGDGTLLVQQRTPWGVVRVSERVKDNLDGNADDPEPIRRYTERTLQHGNILHGGSITEPPELRRYPTGYYHESNPVGRVMLSTAWFTPLIENQRDWRQNHRQFAANDARIAASIVAMGTVPLGVAPFPMEPIMTIWSEPPYAIVGLGAGALYAYAHPFQWVDAYEIDPAMVALSGPSLADVRPAGPGHGAATRVIPFSPDLASRIKSGGPPIFHYILEAQERGVQGEILLGDARRSLTRPGREGFYQMIFIDAFNSQAIPTHLLTEEALVIYFQKLAPDGVLCIHTSNRHIDLPQVLQRMAQRLDIAARGMRVMTPEPRGAAPGFIASDWVVIARNPMALDPWVRRGGLDRIEFLGPGRGMFQRPLPFVMWNDDHANTTSLLRRDLAWTSLLYGLLGWSLVFGVVQGIIEMVISTLAPARTTAPNKKGAA